MTVLSLSRSVCRAVGWLIVILCAVLVITLLVFRFAPQSIVSLSNKLTPYTIHTTELNTQLLPLAIRMTSLNVQHADNSANHYELLSAQALLLKVDWFALVKSKPDFWVGELSGGQIDIPSISALSNNGEKNTASEHPAPINIHHLLSLLNLKISNTSINIAPQTSVLISELNTRLENNTGSKQTADSKQNIDLSISYGEQNKSVSISGDIQSRQQNGFSDLTLNISELDLSKWFKATTGDKHKTEVNQTPSESSRATPIDWAWLDTITPTVLTLNSDKIIVNENSLTNTKLNATLDQSIKIDALEGTLELNASPGLWVKDRLSLSGELKPIENHQVALQLQLNASDSQWQLSGAVDPVKPLNSIVQLAINIDALPLVDESGEDNVLLQELSQWLPLATKMELQPSKNSTPVEGVEISLHELKAGQSDLSGQLNVRGLTDANQRLNLNANLASEQLVYVSTDATTEDQSTNDKAQQDKLFSKEAIDWRWLSTLELEGSLNAKTIRMDQRTLDNLVLPIVINQRGMSVDGLTAELGDGAIRTSFNVAPLESGEVALSLDTKVSGIVLNDLKLVDEETLKGGDSRLDIALSTTGASAHNLASNLNGKAVFYIKEATIGNDAFELIGSDLVAELIAKLNPFLKSDPSTDLKCAVVNLNINDGQIKVDKSIAMKTSKMVIVADGKIDLDNEKLRLAIHPHSTDGLGLDAGSIVKFLELGGTLANPKPIVGAGGLLKTGVAVGAALSTGGASLLVDGIVSKAAGGEVCKKALKSHFE